MRHPKLFRYNIISLYPIPYDHVLITNNMWLSHCSKCILRYAIKPYLTTSFVASSTLSFRDCYFSTITKTSSNTEQYVLGIESTCDDTGIAVVSTEGRILSYRNASQWSLLHYYGGVHPKFAAREHQKHIEQLVTHTNGSNITFI